MGIVYPNKHGASSGTFIDAPDTPSTYAGQAAKGIRVNATETGLEFFVLSGMTDEFVKVGAAGTADYLNEFFFSRTVGDHIRPIDVLYTPTTPADWSTPNPTKMTEALDTLAALAREYTELILSPSAVLYDGTGAIGLSSLNITLNLPLGGTYVSTLQTGKLTAVDDTIVGVFSLPDRVDWNGKDITLDFNLLAESLTGDLSMGLLTAWFLDNEDITNVPSGQVDDAAWASWTTIPLARSDQLVRRTASVSLGSDDARKVLFILKILDMGGSAFHFVDVELERPVVP